MNTARLSPFASSSSSGSVELENGPLTNLQVPVTAVKVVSRTPSVHAWQLNDPTKWAISRYLSRGKAWGSPGKSTWGINTTRLTQRLDYSPSKIRAQISRPHMKGWLVSTNH